MILRTARQTETKRTARSPAQSCRLHPGSTGRDSNPQPVANMFLRHCQYLSGNNNNKQKYICIIKNCSVYKFVRDKTGQLKISSFHSKEIQLRFDWRCSTFSCEVVLRRDTNQGEEMDLMMKHKNQICN